MTPQSGEETPAVEGTPLLSQQALLPPEPPPSHPQSPATGIPASLYVISGVTQPLLMTLLRDAGLADPKGQLYMLFYYLGPASIGLRWIAQNERDQLRQIAPTLWARALGITVFDMAATAMNYGGAALAGPTIFAIVYSSVTVWTAVFSRLLLKRHLQPAQWMGIVIVFVGLALTATDVHSLSSSAHSGGNAGNNVAHGLALVVVGSAMHGMTYVLCEVVMVVDDKARAHIRATLPKFLQVAFIDSDDDDDRPGLSVTQNCAIQGINAVVFMLVWQLLYTLPRWNNLVLEPMEEAGTTVTAALVLLGGFGLANLVHAISYFFTLRHFPGGAVSAGVMKGLQAVLVFVVTDRFFCGRTGGAEMCFSSTKLVSLVTVVGGVVLFGMYNKKKAIDELQQVRGLESSSTNNVL